MSGLVDSQKIMDAVVQGFFVSSTLKLVFERGAIGSVVGRENLMRSLKIGGATHIYKELGEDLVKSARKNIMG